MSDPRFSIVIPAYNRSRYIAAAIDSVLAQDLQSFEVIVVDDGSTDDTEQVVKKYTDRRVRYIKQQNKERAAARNTGIRSSKGSFITFLDSDDVLYPDHLSAAWTFIDQHQPMIFHQGYHVADPSGKVLHPWVALPSPANGKLLDGNYLSCMGVFLNREVCSKFLFNEDRQLSGSEDYEYWLRLAAHYDILTSPVVTAALINHEGRSVIQTNAEKLIARIELLKKYIRADGVFVNKYARSLHRWDAYLDIYVALHLSLMKGHSAVAISYLWKSFQKHPVVITSRRFWVIPKKIVLG